MTGTFGHPPARPTTWPERLFVLGGLGLAALYTAAALALGTGTEHIGPLWLAAVAWTVIAAIAHVLWLGLFRADWSAFRDCEPPDGDDEAVDLDTRTGSYSYLRDWEESHRHDDDHLR